MGGTVEGLRHIERQGMLLLVTMLQSALRKEAWCRRCASRHAPELQVCCCPLVGFLMHFSP